MSINLTATNQSLELVTTTTTPVDAVVNYRNNNAGAQTPGSQDAGIVTAATTTIKAAPAASQQDMVDDVELAVKGTGTNQLTVQKNIGGTLRQLISLLLSSGERLHFTNDMGWRAFDAFGREKGINMGFSLLAAPVLLTSGTSFTFNVGCTAALLELWGGGGQGGGGSSGAGVASSHSAGTGGWAGAYGRKFIVGLPSAAVTYAIGAGGTTGTATSAGQDGGSTTITINGVTYTIVGGKGGAVGPAVGTSVNFLSAIPAPIVLGTHNCDEAFLGNAPGLATRLLGTVGKSGFGGSSQIGRGGVEVAVDAAGDPGTGQASGGSGGNILATTGRAGGVGTNGAVRIWQFTS